MRKLDLKKELKHLYAPSSREVQIVDVPAFNFIVIDGAIEPGEQPDTSAAFRDAMQALYGMAYTLKFMSKQDDENPVDYVVMALEGLWWAEDGEFDFRRKDDWCWTLMIMQPDHITPEMYREALQELRQRRDDPVLSRMRFESFHEGLSMQIMHVGPYAEEPRTVSKMKSFAEENGYRLRGKHHEIYLGDPRRAKPENLRTILRHPVEPVPVALA